MIAIVDYGAGNIQSVCNMLRALNLPARVASRGEEIEGAERILLPGVGHFDHGMTSLEERGFIPALNDAVMVRKVPLLGICLGAQLIARRSAEGVRPGLGWVAADVVAFDRSRLTPDLRIPHMGWAETWLADDVQSPQVFRDAFKEDARFYFVHSFHLECDDPRVAFLRAWYGYEFAAGVLLGNVVGMQFHPEKSHDFGKRVLQAFAQWQPGEGTA